MKILEDTSQLKMEYLKLLMVPQLKHLIVPCNIIEQEAGRLLLTSTDCSVKNVFKKF